MGRNHFRPLILLLTTLTRRPLHWTTCTVYPNLSPFSCRYSTRTFSPTAGLLKGMNFVFRPTLMLTTSAASPSSKARIERLFGDDATTSPDSTRAFLSSGGAGGLVSSMGDSGAGLGGGVLTASFCSGAGFFVGTAEGLAEGFGGADGLQLGSATWAGGLVDIIALGGGHTSVAVLRSGPTVRQLEVPGGAGG